MNMKKIMICILIMFAFLAPVTPVNAEEGSEETVDLTDTFYVITTKEDRTLHVPFSRSWFKNDARVYDHDLAKLSLGLATSAFRPNKKIVRENQQPDYYARFFLDQAGFTDLRSDDYDKDPSMYTVSTVMGHQTIGEGDDAFELIALGICGQGYMDEWESNLSIGTGKNPDGFSGAAHLVYDRVFGYISENRLKGKLKIWLSGFSRAAAVSNITASLLSDSDTFSQETVFAYTFATPMTVRETQPKLYENIFNICGKMDPVPNVPFADWGYSRYGITYFTPTMETDSDFWEKRKKADKVYEELTGIAYWANPDMNSQLRVLMDCMLNVCPDVETYHDHLQENLISLWEKHDAVSLIRRLFDLADNPILVNEENRVEANLLMNQVAYLILDYVNAGNSFRRYNQNASVGSNLLQTHTPELYVSWVFSADDPKELYSDSSEYRMLFVSGDTVITLYRDKEALETMEYGDTEAGSYHYLGLRDFKTYVLIPQDADHGVSIRSLKDQQVEVLEAGFQTGRHSPEDTRTYTAQMHAGDVMKIDFTSSGSSLVPDSSFEVSAKNETEKTAASFELLVRAYESPYGLSWRDLTLFILMAGVLAVTSVLFVITLLSMWLRHRYKKERGYISKAIRFRPLPIICFFLIQQVFLFKEFFTALFDRYPGTISLCKAAIGLLILIIAFYGYRRKKDRFHLLIIFAVLLLTGADLVMTVSITAGALLYIGAYVLLCYDFIDEDKPGIFRILIWIALSATGTYLIMRQQGDFGLLRYLAVLYVIAGAALVVSAFIHSSRTSLGSILLVTAGILIVVNTTRGNSFLLHFISSGLHYMAVCMMASTGSGYMMPKVLQEETAEQ